MSHALLRYHSESKAGLRKAIDDDVLGSFGRSFAAVQTEGVDDLARAGEAAARVFGADQDRRRYVRRSLLEGGEQASALFGRLVAGARREIDRLLADGDTLSAVDRYWAPYQVLFIILGPLLLEPVLQAAMDEDLFAPDVLQRRSLSNQRLLRSGILERSSTTLPSE